MEDIKVIDLGPKDSPREFGSVTHLSYDQSSISHLPHLDLMDLPTLSLVRHYPLTPLHDLSIPTYSSFAYLFFDLVR